eukprot:COSAG02_NODE_786_length_17199_cov_25.278889_22_plen_44_part_00
MNGLSSFDVKDAHCYDPGDEQRLRCVARFADSLSGCVLMKVEW